MAEYIEREALIAKLQAHKDLFVKAWGSFRKMPEKDKARVDAITTCISDVMNATAADVVEVVRCKDCRHNVANWDHDELDATDYSDITCDFFMTDGMLPEDFCSHGTRGVDFYE